MRIAMIGSGYTGLVTGAGLADLGLTVRCVDTDEEKVRLLQDGKIPIYEPGLEEIVRRNRLRGRLSFSADILDAIRDSSVLFIAVGTDRGPDGLPDLSHFWLAADTIAESLEDYKTIVIKSTVAVGTAAKLSQRIQERLQSPVDFDIVSNPEFLREGSAVEDFFHPDRIIIGGGSARAIAVMKDIYRPLYLIETPFVFTTSECAELIKYAANAFLALKISFINELANLCDAVGPRADVHVLAHALGLDNRIGSKFLHPGAGFGGYCLPKDTRALLEIARSFGQDFKTVGAAIEVNRVQFQRIVEKLKQGLGSLAGQTVAILGLAFKPNTDDVRESRALEICGALLRERCALRVYDPAALERARRALDDHRIRYCSDAYEAAEGAGAVIVCTEWNEFRNLDLERVRRRMSGEVLVDARNIFDPAAAKKTGFRYFGIGRA